MRKTFLIYAFLGLDITLGWSQIFYFGNDLSYVNQMEDCGVIYKENGEPKDVYQIFADNGANLVRLRLWHNPDWQNPLQQPDGVKAQYSDFEDVKEAISRAKGAGMNVMLGFQFSDFWADPGRQVVPSAWVDIATDINKLKDSVYTYVTKVLTALDDQDLMPEFVKIGNENNSGIMTHLGMDQNYNQIGPISSDWNRHAQLYNMAIKAVRDKGSQSSIDPFIVLHCSDIQHVEWWYDNITQHGVTDFDVIGFSYYYAWHKKSIDEMGSLIRKMKTKYPNYEVMVVETGYLWDQENIDDLVNIINVPDPRYLPVSPVNQLKYMVDYTKEVVNSGGIGVVFWEPAWVSTPCRTPWGQGSSQEHVAFFDHRNELNFMKNGGGGWMDSLNYIRPTSLDEGHLDPLQFRLYPNPVDKVLYVEWNDRLITEFKLKVYDMEGRLMMSKDIVQQKTINEIHLDIQNLRAGLYHLKLADNNNLVPESWVFIKN